MSSSPNPFSQPEPWSLVAEGYEQTTLHFLGQFSKEALTFADLTPDSHILDVACGPGTLSRLAYPLVKAVDALDFADNMVALFQAFIVDKALSHVTVCQGDGQYLPFADNTYDAAFSMFGLMFFPDRIKGFSELKRVLKPGKKAVVSSWAPVNKSPAMNLMFGALRAGNPNIPEPEENVLSLENPDVFKSEMEQAGFKEVVIHSSTQPLPAPANTKAFWDFMVLGSAPIVMMKKNLSEADWNIFEQKALVYLETHLPLYQNSLTSQAWIGVGIA
jgi:ubiquinone/menaquinone biosynthesis C-methylase UbiE